MIRGLARFSVAFSTIALRLAAYIFLRWIPSHVLWPAVIFLWIQFILSFILLLYLDLEPSEPVVSVETTDIIEIVGDGPHRTIVETEIETETIEPPRKPRPVSWMETIYLGIPGVNPLLSFATTAFNAALLMMTLDLTFRAYLFHPATDLAFHRPIPTTPYSANIFIRSPYEDQLPLQILYKPVDSEKWEIGPVLSEFNNETDFTSVVSLDGLNPQTPYTYAVLPPEVGVISANQSAFGTFETFPHPGRRGRWSFGSSSCIKAGLPYNPLDHPLRIQGLEYLERDLPNLKFFAFLGKFAYLKVNGR
jgi:alkaline phosphatase D